MIRRLDLQLRTGTLLALTAWLAVALGLAVESHRLWRLSQHYRRLAAEHADLARRDSRLASRANVWADYLKEDVPDLLHRADETTLEAGRAAWLDRSQLVARVAAIDAVRAADHRRRAAYHGWLAAKYREAARCPWLPVASDAPEPP